MGWGGGGIFGGRAAGALQLNPELQIRRGQSLTYVCVCEPPVYIFVRAHVCTGTFAIAAMEGTDGRGKWTPVPEDYCGA